MNRKFYHLLLKIYIIWGPPSQSELTPYYIIFNMELTYFGSKASIYKQLRIIMIKQCAVITQDI